MGAGRGRRNGMIVLILIFIIILVVGIGALLFLQSQTPTDPQTGDTTGGATDGGTEIPPTPTTPPTVQVIVAARDIPRGARLSVQDVTVISWPLLAEAPPPTDALIVSSQEGEPGLEQVEDRIARVDILNGQPILNFMLTQGDQPTDLANVGSDAALLIPSGQVAVAMPINRLSSVGYSIREGDHVDLLMSFRFVDVDEDFQTLLPNSALLLTDEQELADIGLNVLDEIQYGREEDGPFGTTLIIFPNTNDITQRSRQATQLLIDNAMVLHVGNWPLAGLNEPIVITPVPPPTASATEEGGGEAPPPTATPIVLPDVVTLTMSRQDALVLKYALETGADVDLALRSALDDDVANIPTDTVTLQYLIDFYNVAVPPRLPIAQDPRIDGNPGGGVLHPPTEEAPTTAEPAQ
jgi:Flp pilus assembly protein CpaB